MQKKPLYLVIALIIALFTFCPALNSQDLTRQRSFSTIALSHSDIVDCVKSINAFTGYNKDSIKSQQYFIVKYEKSEIRYENIDDFTSVSMEGNCVSFRYFYYMPNSLNGISEINIDLNKHDRSLSVSGKDHNKVSGLFKIIEEKIEQNQTFVNYSYFDFPIFLFFILIIIITVAFFQIYSEKQKPGCVPILLFLLTVLFLVIFGITKAPEFRQSVFPDFVIYKGEKSFLSRYADFFGFIGFIALIIGIAKEIYKYLKKPPKSVK